MRNFLTFKAIAEIRHLGATDRAALQSEVSRREHRRLGFWLLRFLPLVALAALYRCLSRHLALPMVLVGVLWGGVAVYVIHDLAEIALTRREIRRILVEEKEPTLPVSPRER